MKKTILALSTIGIMCATPMMATPTYAASISIKYPNREIENGRTGIYVRDVQTQLNKRGYNCGLVDGDFGTKTKIAVEAFQKSNDLTANGVVNGATWNKLFGPNADGTIENLGIYYGYPSDVDGSNGNLTEATNVFKKFQIIVFGDGLEHTNNSDHNNTQKIIDNLKPTKNEVFGYVPIGTNSSKLSITTIEQDISGWKQMGVYGVFLDEYGFDYGVTRTKQNAIVTYAHNCGLKVIANAWVPSDAMGDKNEKGQMQPTDLRTGDYYLMEGWISSDGQLQSTSQWTSKANEASTLSKETGIKVLVASTTQKPSNRDINNSSFKLALNETKKYGFTAFQWTDGNYSSSNNILNFYTLK